MRYHCTSFFLIPKRYLLKKHASYVWKKAEENVHIFLSINSINWKKKKMHTVIKLLYMRDFFFFFDYNYKTECVNSWFFLQFEFSWIYSILFLFHIFSIHFRFWLLHTFFSIYVHILSLSFSIWSNFWINNIKVNLFHQIYILSTA